MSGALGWLNDLVRWLGKLIPRLTLVPPTHRGVLFTARGKAVNKGCGLTFWWPIAQQLHAVPVTTLSLQVNARSMLDPSADVNALLPRVAMCGLAVQYRVVDPVKAAVRCLNLPALVSNRMQAAMGEGWLGLENSKETVNAALEHEAVALLDEFGIVIERGEITQVGLAVALLKLQDWSHEDHEFEIPSLKSEG